jgi:hypothetical protein
MMVKTNDRVVDAYLGPTWFVKEFMASFAKGSKVHIVGSTAKYGNLGVLLVREIRKGTVTLFLRDKEGNPYWREPSP